MKRSVCTLFLFLFVFTFSSVNAFEREEQDAYYEFSNWSCRVKGNKAHIKIHKRMSINNRRGDKYSYVVFSEDSFHKIKYLEVTISNNTGEIKSKLSKKDLNKHCGFGEDYQVYSDKCYYTYDIPCVNYPTFIEYSYEYEIKSLFFLQGPTLVADLPVKQAQCKIRFPKNISIRHKTYGLNMQFDSTEEEHDYIYVWTASDIEPVDTASLSTLEGSRAGSIALVPDRFEFAGTKFQGNTWQAVGRWYLELLKDYLDLRKIKSSDLSLQEKLNAMKTTYDSICDRFRYVSVSIGEGGWKPRKLKKISSTSYGDCKDLSMILIANLRELGITAYPALVLTRGAGYLDIDFPGFGFNHVITAAILDNDTIWLDPTCSICSFGDIPYQDENIPVLMIDTSGCNLVTTSSSKAHDNTVASTARLYITDQFTYSGNVKVRVTGNDAQAFKGRWPHKTKKEIKQSIQSWIVNATQPVVENISISGLNNRDSAVQITFDIHSKRKLRSINKATYLEPVFFGRYEIFKESDTVGYNNPIDLRYPETIIDSVFFILDKSLVDSIVVPSGITYSNSIFDFDYQAQLFDDSVIVQNSIIQKVYEVQPDEFDELFQADSVIKVINQSCLKLFTR